MDIKWLIIESERLEFNNSKSIIHEFIDNRIKYFCSDSVVYINKEDLEYNIKKYENELVVIIDIMNPFIDFDLIRYACEKIEQNALSCVIVEGAIPGTQFEYIKAPNVCSVSSPTILLWNSQRKYNNQFNLYKYKRLKMFESVVDKNPDLYKYSIEELLHYFSVEIADFLIGYGEDVRLMKYDRCPHCGGELIDLPLAMSQPFCGYIPSNISLYHRCIKCGLSVMSPYINPEGNHKIYDQYDKADFEVSLGNPYTAGSTRCKLIDELVRDGKLGTAVYSLDLGGGCGNFSKYLKKNYANWCVTHSDYDLKENKFLNNLGIHTRVLDFVNDEIEENAFDLITAWEVIEHIPFEKFDKTINKIRKSLKKDGLFVFSTPDFDSPLCQINDFFAICPPYHYTVFGTNWLYKYFDESNWEVIEYRACSDFLDDSDMWCKYSSLTAPTFQLRAVAKILGQLFSKENNRKLLLDLGWGTEVIFVVKRRN